MSNKRTSKYGVMYDDKRSKANLDKIVFDIKAEVEFNILTGDVLPFKINEKLPDNINSVEWMYICSELDSEGIVIVMTNMEVVDLL